MDVPRRPFPDSRLNCLSGAVHPKYGLAWTDGESVFLIGICQSRSTTRKLETLPPVDGHSILGLFWNASPWSEKEALLCVLHGRKLSSTGFMQVYSVSSSSSSSSSSRCQVKISSIYAPFAGATSAGVLWNPQLPAVLCFVSRAAKYSSLQECKILFFTGQREDKSLRPQRQTGSSSSISCGIWTPDGRTLLLGVGSTIQIWTWPNLQAVSDDIPEAPVVVRRPTRPTNLGGDIVSILPVSNDYILYTTSVSNFSSTSAFSDLISEGKDSPPLTPVNGRQNDNDHFNNNVNGSNALNGSNDGDSGHSSTVTDADFDPGAKKNGTNDTGWGNTINNIGDGDDPITLRPRPTERHRLFNIHGPTSTPVPDDASLAKIGLLAKEGDEWKWMMEESIPGILSPNLAAIHPVSTTPDSTASENVSPGADAEVMVGSCSADRLLRFRLRDFSLQLMDQVVLPRGCRLRGVVSSKEFLDGKAPSPFVVAVTHSYSSSFSASSSGADPFEQAFVPSKANDSHPVALHFLDLSSSHSLSPTNDKIGSQFFNVAKSADLLQHPSDEVRSGSENICGDGDLDFMQGNQLDFHQSRQNQSQQSSKQQQQQHRHQSDEDSLRNLMRNCVFALRAADPKDVSGICQGTTPMTTTTSTTTMTMENSDLRIPEISGDNQRELNVTNVGGGDGPNFLDLLNEIGDIFDGGRGGGAAGGAGGGGVVSGEDGLMSREEVKSQEGAGSAAGVVGGEESNGSQLGIGRGGRGERVVTQHGVTNVSSEPEDATTKTLRAKSSLRNVLDTGKKGSIDMMALLAERGGGGGRGKGEEGIGATSELPVAVGGGGDGCRGSFPGGGDLVPCVGGGIGVSGVNVSIFGGAGEMMVEESSPQTQTPHSFGIAPTLDRFDSAAENAAEMSTIEERLEAIESKLMNRLKERRRMSASSTAVDVDLMELRIQRIEKLVEMICDD